jgi:hypothetical protein
MCAAAQPPRLSRLTPPLRGTFDLLRVTCSRFSQCLVDRLIEPHQIVDVFDAQLSGACYPEPYDARPWSAEFRDHLHNIAIAVRPIVAVRLGCGVQEREGIRLQEIASLRPLVPSNVCDVPTAKAFTRCASKRASSATRRFRGWAYRGWPSDTRTRAAAPILIGAASSDGSN